jgi:hypothetical protein
MLYKGEQSTCSVKFSPFLQGRLALACAQNFGIVGNGSVVILQAQESGLQKVAAFDTVDGTAPSRAAFKLCEAYDASVKPILSSTVFPTRSRSKSTRFSWCSNVGCRLE